jgi:hypothetical protein
MALRRNATVVDPDLVQAQIREFVVDDTHTAEVIVELATGARLSLPSELLGPAPDGGYRVGVPWAELMTVEEPPEPALREKFRVRRRVVSDDHDIETPVWRERITVEKVPIDTFVDRVPEVRKEGDLLIVPCVEEVVVTERRLHLREELRIRVIRERVVDRRTIVVRRHHIPLARHPTPRKNEEGD